MARRFGVAAVALAACNASPATVEDIAARAKDHSVELEQLRKDMLAEGIRAVGYRSVTGAGGMSCGALNGSGAGDWQCTVGASTSKKLVRWEDVPSAVGMSQARYKNYLKLLDAVRAEDATAEPSGVLDVYVVSRRRLQRGLTWCPGPPSDHPLRCHHASRTYTALDGGWYAWQ